jgi:hypothetical protein
MTSSQATRRKPRDSPSGAWPIIELRLDLQHPRGGGVRTVSKKKVRPPEVVDEQHVARPEQYQEGFETGYDQGRDTPEELLGPNFARGIAEERPGPPRQGRFSEGSETTDDTDEKTRERRFSEGVEGRPEDR